MKHCCYIENEGRYLDYFGSTKDEMEWTPNKRTAFAMDRAAADRRLIHVRKFFPAAKIVESGGAK